MRVLILALFVLGILVSANVAKAGPSTTDRDLVASADPAILAEEATQETEDQIGLDKARRRDVQRRMTRLGFDTKINGKFDDPTRAVIARWQAARGYPKTGFLNTLQHKALLTEIVSAQATSSDDDSSDDRPSRRHHSSGGGGGGGGGRHYRGGGGGGGPGGFIGGMVGGMFR